MNCDRCDQPVPAGIYWLPGDDDLEPDLYCNSCADKRERLHALRAERSQASRRKARERERQQERDRQQERTAQRLAAEDAELGV